MKEDMVVIESFSAPSPLEQAKNQRPQLTKVMSRSTGDITFGGAQPKLSRLRRGNGGWEGCASKDINEMPLHQYYIYLTGGN